MRPAGNAGHGKRFAYIDLLKAVASQLIVLHHLAFYGPMADFVHPGAPRLIDWLGGDARIAVQIFLVVGGFLAARTLCPDGCASRFNVVGAVFHRWLKLVPPYAIALLAAVAASGVAATLMTHHSISGLHGWRQLLAHILLMQDVLGYEALSAGVWYIAIDFQLYAMFALLVWCCGLFHRIGPQWLMPVAVGCAGALSLAVFNRDPALDVWGIYFFGSYALGSLAWWAADPQRPRGMAIVYGAVLVISGVYALELEFRTRIAVALVTALLLLAWRLGALAVPRIAAAGFLARISYALLLVHFPVSLVVNAVFAGLLSHQPAMQGVGMLTAWAASVAAAAAFHRWVEVPLATPVRRVASAVSGFAKSFGTIVESMSMGIFGKMFKN
jgi:peptidoglycan/LPS O-acetylase OafA/YrhL